DSRHTHGTRAKCDEGPRRVVSRAARHPSVPPSSSAALRKPAHVALGAALDERELRSAVGTGTDEILLRAAGAKRGGGFRPSLSTDRLAHRSCGGGPPRPARPPRSPGPRPSPAQQILLDSLLLLHPFLDRDTDRVGDREHLVRPEPDDSIGRDAPQLAVHLAQRDARAQRE